MGGPAGVARYELAESTHPLDECRDCRSLASAAIDRATELGGTGGAAELSTMLDLEPTHRVKVRRVDPSPEPGWVVVGLHPLGDCPDCAALAKSAVSHARATGSAGADMRTYRYGITSHAANANRKP